jgi:hypothetical protein
MTCNKNEDTIEIRLRNSFFWTGINFVSRTGRSARDFETGRRIIPLEIYICTKD